MNYIIIIIFFFVLFFIMVRLVYQVMFDILILFIRFIYGMVIFLSIRNIEVK